MTLTNWLAIWAIVSVLAAPLVGHLLHKQAERYRINRDFNRELNHLLDREALIQAMKNDIEADREMDNAFMCGEDEQPHNRPAA